MANNIYIDTSKTKNIYADTNKVKKIYRDTDMIWQSAIPIARPTSAQLNPTATYTGDVISNGFSMTGVEYVRGATSGTNVADGPFVAYYRPDEEHIWEDTEDRAEVAVTLTITKANSAVISAPTNRGVTYSGSAQAIANAGTCIGGTLYYKAADTSQTSYGAGIPTAANVGRYNLYYYVSGDSNHYDTAEASISCTIAKATGYVSTVPTNRDATATTYNTGIALCNAGSGTGTMYYSTISASSGFSTSIPTKTAGGTYTVWYYAEESENYTRSAVGSVSCRLYPDYLCFTSNTSETTISMDVWASGMTPTLGQNFQYSTDRTNWYTFVPGSTTVALSGVGSKLYFKGNNPNGITEYDANSNFVRYRFETTNSIACSGNIMSLIDNGSCVCTTIPNAHCFTSMFGQCAITSAPSLPATSLTPYCYYQMFEWCTSLTQAPALPATTLASDCYAHMFEVCVALIVSDASGSGYDKPWTIPASGTFGNTYEQSSMFSSCARGSGRSSNAMAGVAGESYTFYTQNTPV